MTDLRLGYLGFEVRDLPAWEAFATDVLGLGVSGRGDDGSLGLRMDAQRQRFVLSEGPSDDLAFVGWEAPDDRTLDALVARLGGAGVAVTATRPEEAAARRVRRLCRLLDPAGIPLELFVGPEVPAEAFQSPHVRSGFVTGELGLGHLVLSAPDRDASLRFYQDLLGFRLSDRIVCEIYGYPVDIVFLHANRRHHSLALGDRQKKRLHHFMLEVGSMDDVGLACDRAVRKGVRLMQTLGKHPNDQMFSFYARTPSGFQFEFGWGGRKVDDASWQPTTYDHISEWGHHPPQFLAEGKIK